MSEKISVLILEVVSDKKLKPPDTIDGIFIIKEYYALKKLNLCKYTVQIKKDEEFEKCREINKLGYEYWIRTDIKELEKLGYTHFFEKEIKE